MDFEDLQNEMDRLNGRTIERDDTIIHFGKWQGTKWCDLPFGYLSWLSKNLTDTRLRALARRAMNH